ncbi:MAG: sugar ABC transporter substrate-binding protein [Treponema sp.]|jgi:ribose transport system substrate-binding protein|nr:sugar ABC transporter substrate-binding protein [Treponema sp.]
MKKLTGIVTAVLLAALLAGCGGVKVDSGASSPVAAEAVAANPRVIKDPYVDPVKIAFIPWTIGDSVGAAWGDGIERELKNFSNVTFNRYDGKASAETQVTIITELINQKVDGIILQSSDSAALAASVRQAEDAGIPVVCLNLDADTPHAALVAMVDVEAGALIAREIAGAIGSKGNVVIIQAAIGASRGERLETGFRGELAKYPDVKILDAQTGDWLTEKANVVMNDFLTKYPKIDGVFAHNDAMAEGASAAAEAAGRLKDMVIWGADGEKKALEYIENGKMTGTIYTNCYDQGATAARLIMYFINSEANTAAFTKTPIVKMSPIIVTSQTVRSIGPDIRW